MVLVIPNVCLNSFESIQYQYFLRSIGKHDHNINVLFAFAKKKILEEWNRSWNYLALRQSSMNLTTAPALVQESLFNMTLCRNSWLILQLKQLKKHLTAESPKQMTQAARNLQLRRQRTTWGRKFREKPAKKLPLSAKQRYLRCRNDELASPSQQKRHSYNEQKFTGKKSNKCVRIYGFVPIILKQFMSIFQMHFFSMYQRFTFATQPM